MNTQIDLTHASHPDLSAHRVVILGGTGAVGEGIVRAWLHSGAKVIVPSRTQHAADTLNQALGNLAESPNLNIFITPTSTFTEAEAAAERIVREHGEVTDVIASIGGWWQGRALWEITTEDWDQFFVGFITAHVAQVRAWIPRLPHRGSYQLILGGSATQPVPGASLMNMEQAALLMMRQVLTAEVKEQRRVTSVVLGPVDTRQRSWVDPSWVSNNEVGLATAGIAARDDSAGNDYVLRTKEHMLSLLQQLAVFPAATPEVSQ